MKKGIIKEITKAVLAVIAVGALVATFWVEPSEATEKAIYIIAGIAIGYYFPKINRENLIKVAKK